MNRINLYRLAQETGTPQATIYEYAYKRRCIPVPTVQVGARMYYDAATYEAAVRAVVDLRAKLTSR